MPHSAAQPARSASPPARLAALTALVVGALSLAGCGGVNALRQKKAELPPVSDNSADHETTAALLLADAIQTLQRLATSTAAEQAEIVASARAAYERAPMGPAQLRYALTLGAQGNLARDPERARALLRELAAQPAELQPAERALAMVALAQFERELGLKAENDRLQADAAKTDAQRQNVANRRLQTALEENAKLKHQLEEAQAKLDAIVTIERNVSGH